MHDYAEQCVTFHTWAPGDAWHCLTIRAPEPRIRIRGRAPGMESQAPMIGFCGDPVSPLFRAVDGWAQSSGRALWRVLPHTP
ncbi:hypothetical protein GCM10010519_14680 [Streptomyces lactacystinicus]